MDLCTKMAIINKGRVLYEGAPDSAIAELEGRIWKRSIAKTELAEYQKRFKVVSSKLVSGRPFLHVYSEQSLDSGFAPSAPDLEDVFFAKINDWV
jgi:ABC-type multidrug transport system ATPase subunit